MHIAVPIKAIITGDKNIALLDHPKFMLDGKALGDAVYSADPLVNSMLIIDEYSYANETELMDLGSVHELLKQLRGNRPYAPKNMMKTSLAIGMYCPLVRMIMAHPSYLTLSAFPIIQFCLATNIIELTARLKCTVKITKPRCMGKLQRMMSWRSKF